MQAVSTFLVYAALAGAVASWIAAVVFGLRTLRELSGNRPLLWLALVAWPFAVGRTQGAAAANAANANKALVAFIACVLVGVAAFSASANLHRFAK